MEFYMIIFSWLMLCIVLALSAVFAITNSRKALAASYIVSGINIVGSLLGLFYLLITN